MRKGLGLFLALALTTPFGVMFAGPAGSATPLLKCKALNSVESWSKPLPPITGPTKANKVSGTIKLTATITGCSGVPGITSGTSTSTTPYKNQNCTTLITSLSKPSPTKGVIKWNNGKTTNITDTLTQTSKVGAIPIVLKLVSKYTAGISAGHTVTSTLNATLNSPKACISVPLSKATAKAVGTPKYS
jgi:hypothetical protein